MVSSTPRPHFTPGKDTVPILQEAGWDPGRSGRAENLFPTEIRSRTVQPVVAIPTELPGPHLVTNTNHKVPLYVVFTNSCHPFINSPYFTVSLLNICVYILKKSLQINVTSKYDIHYRHMASYIHKYNYTRTLYLNLNDAVI